MVFSSEITNSKNAVSLKLLRSQYFVPGNVSDLRRQNEEIKRRNKSH